ncbi:hypothetical protein CCACVL1_11813 [Corchorus capsularis]|uniref:Uncharacterized protein n=1 Tax=Corchorus capsularis TaxID=210143 RepID=A0A1R3IJA5_COCAP|nr:hypothetical protein CCACVL1_11813 [Corchorus capsularis]
MRLYLEYHKKIFHKWPPQVMLLASLWPVRPPLLRDRTLPSLRSTSLIKVDLELALTVELQCGVRCWIGLCPA